MDFLDTHSAALEREVFFRTADLFNADVDLIALRGACTANLKLGGARIREGVPACPSAGRAGPPGSPPPP